MNTDRSAYDPRDLELMVRLFNSPRREDALDLADKNREAAKASPTLPERKAA